MGFRMNIYVSNDPKHEYGDDHKMYGYWAFKDVKDSFTYLSKFLREQSPERYEGCDNEEEMYGIFSSLGWTDEVVLDEFDFKVFRTLYLADLIKTGHTSECIEYVKKYMDDLSEKKDNKTLYWR